MKQNWAQNVSEKDKKTEKNPKRNKNEPKRTRNGPISDPKP